jgi:hypothetical protein
MKPVLLAVLRSRVRVGSSETFTAQTAQCPQYKQKLALMWPEHILHVPLHRVVYVDCPGCAISFSFIAIDLISVGENGEEYVAAVVSQVS